MVVISIAQGKLKGGEAKTDNGVAYYEFLGIPYAKPPIGNLRFRNPQPPESWDGERDATFITEDKVCRQTDILRGKQIGSEDCLYLNVYTPRLPDTNVDFLPVMVFVHGGGFITGNGIMKQEYGPDYLINNNVVVVTFNYRLGVLGFLSLDIPEASGNVGLKDQVQALKWVQSNIDKFGGDPNNVTIFGISAGSASIDYHLLSPRSKGLFHKAILQSGSCLNHWTINYEPKKVVEKLLRKMGYNGSTRDSRALHEYLINSPLSDLVEASYKDMESLYPNRMFLGFVPTIEKNFGDNEAIITDVPYKLFKEGKFNRVPIIKGFCNKEGYLVNSFRSHLIPDVIKNLNFVDHWAYKLEASDKIKFNRRFVEAYSGNVHPGDDNDKVGIDFFGDFDFVAGIKISGEIMAKQDVPVYFYEFCYEGKMNFLKNVFGITRRGAAHSDDTSYVFKLAFSILAETKDKEVRANICKMWTNFAKAGKPTLDDVPIQWNNYTEEFPSYLIIGKEFKIGSVYKPEKMAIFKEIYDKYEK